MVKCGLRKGLVLMRTEMYNRSCVSLRWFILQSFVRLQQRYSWSGNTGSKGIACHRGFLRGPRDEGWRQEHFSIRDTDAASYLHADKTWSSPESLSCFNFPDPAGFAFYLQISDLVLQMGLLCWQKKHLSLLSCKSQTHCQLSGTPMLWSQQAGICMAIREK